jgi:hypothetical protein
MSSERDLKAESYDHMTDRPIALHERQEIAFKFGWDSAMQSEEVTKLREENRIMHEALKIASEHLMGIVLYISDCGQNINVQFALEYYEKCANQAREALEKVK